jgi:WD40 repeat protein
MSVDGNLIFFSDSEAHLHVVDLLSTILPTTAGREDVAMSSLEIPHAHESAITSVCVHARSELGASASYDQSLKIWDVNTGALLADHDFEDRLWCVDVHPDGHLVATGGDDRIVHVMPVGERGCELVPYGGVALRGHTDAVIVTNFAPAGARQLRRDLFSSGYDARIIQWDYEAGIALRVWEGHTSVVCSLQILPHVVVSGSRDGTTRVWDSFGGDEPLSVLEGGGAVKCVLTLSSTRFATAGLLNGIVHIWDFSATGHSGSDVKLADTSIDKCVIA